MIVKSPRNAIYNAGNHYQGGRTRILCVCSAGLLRSPTLAHVLATEFGANTRAAGVQSDYALIPVSEALLMWANQIVLVNQEVAESFFYATKDVYYEADIVVLDIPDQYSAYCNDLIDVCREQYKNAEPLTDEEIRAMRHSIGLDGE